MSFRKITNQGDWTFGNGLSNYATGNEAIVLDVRTAILQWTNNWFLNLTEGIDYWTYLRFPNQKKAMIDAISEMIISRNGVANIKDLDIVTNEGERMAVLNITFTTIYNVETNLTTSLQ